MRFNMCVVYYILQSADENWKPAFVRETATLIYKVYVHNNNTQCTGYSSSLDPCKSSQKLAGVKCGQAEQLWEAPSQMSGHTYRRNQAAPMFRFLPCCFHVVVSRQR